MKAVLSKKRSLAALMCTGPAIAFAGPTGGEVVGGAATISTASPLNTVINQSTQRAAINWQSFSIAGNEHVQFNQPNSSSISLNRVVGANPSEILGNLSANGQVFLINPRGVYFGQNASLDVGGLVASTLDIGNTDFMDGNYKFLTSSASLPEGSTVVNDGILKAREGGYVVLAGDEVRNNGQVEAKFGTVALAAGGEVTLDIAGDGLVSFSVDSATTAEMAGVTNTGELLADGGRVVLTGNVANELVSTAVNNEGLIQAQTITEKDGEVFLLGFGGDTVHADGAEIDVTDATDTDAGFVEISSNEGIKVRGTTNIGRGGELFIDPAVLNISSGGASSLGASSISNSFIANQLNMNTNVTLAAGSSINFVVGDGPANIDLGSMAVGTGDFTLMASDAGVDINLNNASINILGDVNLNAGTGDITGVQNIGGENVSLTANAISTTTTPSFVTGTEFTGYINEFVADADDNGTGDLTINANSLTVSPTNAGSSLFEVAFDAGSTSGTVDLNTPITVTGEKNVSFVSAANTVKVRGDITVSANFVSGFVQSRVSFDEPGGTVNVDADITATATVGIGSSTEADVSFGDSTGGVANVLTTLTTPGLITAQEIQLDFTDTANVRTNVEAVGVGRNSAGALMANSLTIDNSAYRDGSSTGTVGNDGEFEFSGPTSGMTDTFTVQDFDIDVGNSDFAETQIFGEFMADRNITIRAGGNLSLAGIDGTGDVILEAGAGAGTGTLTLNRDPMGMGSDFAVSGANVTLIADNDITTTTTGFFGISATGAGGDLIIDGDFRRTTNGTTKFVAQDQLTFLDDVNSTFGQFSDVDIFDPSGNGKVVFEAQDITVQEVLFTATDGGSGNPTNAEVVFKGIQGMTGASVTINGDITATANTTLTATSAAFMTDAEVKFVGASTAGSVMFAPFDSVTMTGGTHKVTSDKVSFNVSGSIDVRTSAPALNLGRNDTTVSQTNSLIIDNTAFTTRMVSGTSFGTETRGARLRIDAPSAGGNYTINNLDLTFGDKGRIRSRDSENLFLGTANVTTNGNLALGGYGFDTVAMPFPISDYVIQGLGGAGGNWTFTANAGTETPGRINAGFLDNTGQDITLTAVDRVKLNEVTADNISMTGAFFDVFTGGGVTYVNAVNGNATLTGDFTSTRNGTVLFKATNNLTFNDDVTLVDTVGNGKIVFEGQNINTANVSLTATNATFTSAEVVYKGAKGQTGAMVTLNGEVTADGNLETNFTNFGSFLRGGEVKFVGASSAGTMSSIMPLSPFASVQTSVGTHKINADLIAFNVDGTVNVRTNSPRLNLGFDRTLNARTTNVTIDNTAHTTYDVTFSDGSFGSTTATRGARLRVDTGSDAGAPVAYTIDNLDITFGDKGRLRGRDGDELILGNATVVAGGNLALGGDAFLAPIIPYVITGTGSGIWDFTANASVNLDATPGNITADVLDNPGGDITMNAAGTLSLSATTARSVTLTGTAGITTAGVNASYNATSGNLTLTGNFFTSGTSITADFQAMGGDISVNGNVGISASTATLNASADNDVTFTGTVGVSALNMAEVTLGASNDLHVTSTVTVNAGSSAVVGLGASNDATFDGAVSATVTNGGMSGGAGIIFIAGNAINTQAVTAQDSGSGAALVAFSGLSGTGNPTVTLDGNVTTLSNSPMREGVVFGSPTAFGGTSGGTGDAVGSIITNGGATITSEFIGFDVDTSINVRTASPFIQLGSACTTSCVPSMGSSPLALLSIDNSGFTGLAEVAVGSSSGAPVAMGFVDDVNLQFGGDGSLTNIDALTVTNTLAVMAAGSFFLDPDVTAGTVDLSADDLDVGDITTTAVDNVGTTMITEGDLNLTASTSVAAGTLLAQNGDVNVSAAAEMTLSIDSATGNNVTLISPNIVAGSSGQFINATNGDVQVTGDITATDLVTINIDASNNVTIDGMITQTASAGTATLVIEAGSEVFINDAIDVSALGDATVSLVATNGGVTTNAMGTINVASATADALGTIFVGNGTVGINQGAAWTVSGGDDAFTSFHINNGTGPANIDAAIDVTASAGFASASVQVFDGSLTTTGNISASGGTYGEVSLRNFTGGPTVVGGNLTATGGDQAYLQVDSDTGPTTINGNLMASGGTGGAEIRVGFFDSGTLTVMGSLNAMATGGVGDVEFFATSGDLTISGDATVTAQDDFNLTAGMGLTAGALTNDATMGNLNAMVADTMLINSATASNNVTLTATDLNTNTAGTFVNAISGNATLTGDFSASNLSMVTFDAGGNLTINNDVSVTNTSVDADVIFEAGSTLSVTGAVNVSASSNAIVEFVAPSVMTNTVTVTGDGTDVAAEFGTLGNNITLNGSVTVNGTGGEISFGAAEMGSSNTAVNNVTQTAGVLAADTVAFNATGTVNVVTNTPELILGDSLGSNTMTSSFTVDNSAHLGAASLLFETSGGMGFNVGALNVDFGGDANIIGSDVEASSTFDIFTTGKINVMTGVSVNTSGDGILNLTGSSVDINAQVSVVSSDGNADATVTSTGGNVSLNGTNTITVQTTSTNATDEANLDLIASEGNVDINGFIDIMSTQASELTISASATTPSASAGNVIIANNVDVMGGLSGFMDIDADRDVTTMDLSIDGDIDILAGGALTTGVLTARGGNVTTSAGGVSNVGGTVGDTVTVTTIDDIVLGNVTSDVINFMGNSITAGNLTSTVGGVTLNATGTFVDVGTVMSATGVDIDAMTSVSAGAITATTGSIDLDAVGGTIMTGSLAASMGSVTGTAGVDFIAQNILGQDLVDIEATLVLDIGSVNTTSSAISGDIILQAADMGSRVSNIEALTSARNIDIDGVTTSFNLNGAVTANNGMVNIDGASVFQSTGADINASGDVTIGTAGTFQFITSQMGDITITAGPGTITTSRTFTASNGTVSLTAGNIQAGFTGSLINAMTLDLAGGTANSTIDIKTNVDTININNTNLGGLFELVETDGATVNVSGTGEFGSASFSFGGNTTFNGNVISRDEIIAINTSGNLAVNGNVGASSIVFLEADGSLNVTGTIQSGLEVELHAGGEISATGGITTADLDVIMTGAPANATLTTNVSDVTFGGDFGVVSLDNTARTGMTTTNVTIGMQGPVNYTGLQMFFGDNASITGSQVNADAINLFAEGDLNFTNGFNVNGGTFAGVNGDAALVAALTTAAITDGNGTSSPNASFVSGGTLTLEVGGQTSGNQYLLLAADDTVLTGTSSAPGLLVQFTPFTAANTIGFAQSLSSGPFMQDTVYTVDDHFSHFTGTTTPVGLSTSSTAIEVNGSVDVADKNLVLLTTGSVTGFENITGTGVIAVVGVAVTMNEPPPPTVDQVDTNTQSPSTKTTESTEPPPEKTAEGDGTQTQDGENKEEEEEKKEGEGETTKKEETSSDIVEVAEGGATKAGSCQ